MEVSSVWSACFGVLNVFLFCIYRYLVFPPIMGETKTRFSEGELDELLDQLDFEELDLINKYVDPNVRDEIFSCGRATL